MASQVDIGYEDTLRAVGQGLENLQTVAFELEYSEGEFVVSGECQRTAATKPIRKKSFLSLIQNIGSKRPARKPGSATFHFSRLRFNHSDIELLNRKGRALRSALGERTLEPDSLSYMLRMTGTYVDCTASRLTKITWRSPLLTLWLTDKRGRESKEIFKLPEIYDFWFHQFKKRTPAAPLKSTGSD
jgi:hypothetical protein